MTDRPPLTDRQREVLDFIADFMLANQFPPTIRDLMHGLRIYSPNGVVSHLRPLEAKGYITTNDGEARTIRLVDPPCCPFCGSNFGRNQPLETSPKPRIRRR